MGTSPRCSPLQPCQRHGKEGKVVQRTTNNILGPSWPPVHPVSLPASQADRSWLKPVPNCPRLIPGWVKLVSHAHLSLAANRCKHTWGGPHQRRERGILLSPDSTNTVLAHQLDAFLLSKALKYSLSSQEIRTSPSTNRTGPLPVTCLLITADCTLVHCQSHIKVPQITEGGCLPCATLWQLIAATSLTVVKWPGI